MLKINSIELKNFRQFKNIQLSFNRGNGIYLFIGKNGIGKSNFLNALCWCLYEEQPFKTKDENKKILNEEVAQDNEFAEVKVTIEVEMDGKVFRFTRTQVETQKSYLTVLIKKANDWERIDQPTIVVNSFLPKSIRRFFLFDGEAVQKLFTGDYAKNLKDSVLKVSNVELLDSAVEHLTYTYNGLRRNVNKDEPEAEKLEKQRVQLDNLIAQKTKEKISTEKAVSTLKDKELELGAQFEIYKQHKGLQERRSRLEQQKSGMQGNLDKIQIDVNDLMVFLVPFFYIDETLLEVAKKINSARDKGEIPPKIKGQFIQELISRGKCICGTEIGENSKEHKCLKALLEEIIPVDNKSYLVEDSYAINNILQDLEKLPSKMRKLREGRAAELQEIETVERELKEISESLLNSPDLAVGNLENTLQTVKSQIDGGLKTIGGLGAELEHLAKQRNEVAQELDKITKAKSRKDYEVQRLEFINSAKDKIELIRTHLINQVRSTVSLKTDRFFKDLVWKKDVFDQVKFSDEYEVEVLKRGEKSSSLDMLSTGEMKVLGLATIKALAALSGFAAVPVVIDGPLEYLDEEVQSNFLTMLPKFMPEKQVFIFSVDRPSIIKFGKDNVPADNFYELKWTPNSTSTIIKRYEA